MTQEVALHVLAGIRTPLGKAGESLANHQAEDLGTLAAREVILRAGVDPELIDGVVCGNVGQNANAPNVARVIALRAGVPESAPAWTVHRNCASGFEAVTQAATQLAAGRGRLYLVVATESMSNYPLIFRSRARDWFLRLSRSRSVWKKLKTFLAFRPAMMAPEIALMKGLTDPVVGLGMGETAELLARDWHLSREAQDAFAARSHEKALAGREQLRDETFDVVHDRGVLRDDEGVRTDSTPERLARLRTVFQKKHGTVTAGNASQITDGAVALLVGDEDMVREIGTDPLGRLESYAYAGCDPARMGLGPVHAAHRLFPNAPVPECDVYEINEAFAAQVLACCHAGRDTRWCHDVLGRTTPLFDIPEDRLNVNGGAIALGHAVGMTGARLVLTALHELRRRHGTRALVSLCIGGGQGGALMLRAS
ncbi:MAG: acetyl-CoA C-acyltransferase [Planctomycetes bacterium]|nr:acetyl-CoA C-acyltransferase [Planctomycetota bacterium]